MATQVQAAVIAAIVGLVTTGVGALFSVFQNKRERSKWLVELKGGYALELYRERLRTYPLMFATLGSLSHIRPVADIEADITKVAQQLNDWMYSSDGMCADAAVRGAILGLRHSCSDWAISGKRPQDFYQWRNLSIQMLRRDLDLHRNELHDWDNLESLLHILKTEAATLTGNGH
jgi:hypothetical protein